MVEQYEFELGLPEAPPTTEPNKMARQLGYGPEGTTCKTCEHCFKKQYAGTYYKCQKLGDTNGPGTDVRLKWRSCRLYKEANNND